MVKKVLTGMLMGILIISICGCGSQTAQYVSPDSHISENESRTEGEATEDLPAEAGTEAAKLIYVYICGAVAAPGVYAIEEGSRVCDLFTVAGGLTEEAATDYWNQARVLVDGEMLYVPTVEEAKERTDSEKSAASGVTGLANADSSTTGKININTASKEELMTLPGIGESKALAIIAYRQEKGAFSSIEQLKEISGIKDGVFSKIEDYIIIN